jgi:MOSC domain-containing protein YiiM
VRVSQPWKLRSIRGGDTVLALAVPPAVLSSIQIAKPGRYGSDDATDPHDCTWRTGFFKTSLAGPVFVGTTNIEGDGQADLENHGGVDKAVLAYSADHYPKWRRDLGMAAMPHGAFGENLTISGLTEESVHIGDVFRIGEVKFEVSQPRQPCWKLARRWRMHELPSRVIQNGRSGWYLRVLEPGRIAAHMPVILLERPNPEWSVARANEVLHHHTKDLVLARRLAGVPRLADSWVKELRARADRLMHVTLSGRGDDTTKTHER